MESFDGKVAVITGGGSGIGLALAGALGGEGCRVMLADIDGDALSAAEVSLKASGVDVATSLTDVGELAAVEALARSAIERFGRVDIVVNNAGVIAWNPVSALTIADWEWVIKVNLWGLIHGVHVFLPIMREQAAEGHFVNLSSVGGLLADTPFMATYGATKSAVVGLSLSLASDLAVEGLPIGVTIVCPGATRDSHADQAERNRPASAGPLVRAPGVDTMTQRVRQSVEGGQPVEVLAARVVEAIRNNQLWAFPNPDAGPAVRPRLAALDAVLEQAALQSRDG